MKSKEQKTEYQNLEEVEALVIIRGIPGAGKSRLATQLKEVLGENSIKIDPDEYRYMGRTLNNSVQAGSKLELFDFLKDQALRSIKSGKIVVWDQAWTSLKNAREISTQINKMISPAKLFLIEIEIAPSLAWDRIQAREKLGVQQGFTRVLFDTYVEKYFSVRTEDLEGELIVLRDNDEESTNIKLILNRLIKAGVLKSN